MNRLKNNHATIRDTAIKIVKKYYKKKGWNVSEKGKPYDLFVTKGKNQRIVEVKGTTNIGNSFRALLSRNEKKLMEECAKNGRHFYLHVVRGIGKIDHPIHRYFTKSLISKPKPAGHYYVRVKMKEGKI